MEKTLYIYRASAGSGKTFTLAVEYIKLLIANPRAYRHTLAVTFTNKATGEVREQPDVWGELNTSDEYQLSLIINQKISMLVILNPEMQLYAYRKYQLPENLPRVDTKLYMAGWKPSQAASGWRVVNPFYNKK